MNTKSATIAMALVALASTLVATRGFAQPTNLPRINPLTGLPVTSPGRLTPEDGITAGYEAAREVRELTFNRRYEEALQHCLAFHKKWETGASLIPMLGDWVELGRRYPKARAALIEIRDHGVREFSEGRGYFALFQQINTINDYLQDQDSTYKLFQSFRNKDRQLEKQCYFAVEEFLLDRGEYQYCYDHNPDIQGRFDALVRDWKFRQEQYQRSAELAEMSRQRIAERFRQQGFTNHPVANMPQPDPHSRLTTHARDTFVGQTRRLIEILVGAGHKDEAEQIRIHALKLLDDARLKSAVVDAVKRVKH